MKSYYMQLKDLVLPQIVSYATDLTKHDRKHLTYRKVDKLGFLYGFRPTGTDLFDLDWIEQGIREYEENPLSNENSYFAQKGLDALRRGEFNLNMIYSAAALRMNRNTQYAIGRNGVVELVSFERIAQEWDEYERQIIKRITEANASVVRSAI